MWNQHSVDLACCRLSVPHRPTSGSLCQDQSRRLWSNQRLHQVRHVFPLLALSEQNFWWRFYSQRPFYPPCPSSEARAEHMLYFMLYFKPISKMTFKKVAQIGPSVIKSVNIVNLIFSNEIYLSCQGLAPSKWSHVFGDVQIWEARLRCWNVWLLSELSPHRDRCWVRDEFGHGRLGGCRFFIWQENGEQLHNNNREWFRAQLNTLLYVASDQMHGP